MNPSVVFLRPRRASLAAMAVVLYQIRCGARTYLRVRIWFVLDHLGVETGVGRTRMEGGSCFQRYLLHTCTHSPPHVVEKGLSHLVAIVWVRLSNASFWTRLWSKEHRHPAQRNPDLVGRGPEHKESPVGEAVQRSLMLYKLNCRKVFLSKVTLK